MQKKTFMSLTKAFQLSVIQWITIFAFVIKTLDSLCVGIQLTLQAVLWAVDALTSIDNPSGGAGLASIYITIWAVTRTFYK